MSKENPLIGIPGWKTGDNSFGAAISYLEYLNRFGTVRILMPDEDLDANLDLLVLPGGSDIEPTSYGCIPNYNTGKGDPFKEYFEAYMLPEYIEKKIPIFGICRGCQAIAVHFGGMLIQHMYHETSIERFEKVHEIEILNPELSAELKAQGIHRIEVNSMHHQCISDYNFPSCLEVLGRYKGRNNKKIYKETIEVIRHRTLPIWGVQYHPEELGVDKFSDYIIENLLKFYEEETMTLQEINDYVINTMKND